MNNLPPDFPITLVTAYFELEGITGKSPRNYYAWMQNLVPVVQWPLVVFCDEKSVEHIKQLRGNKPAVYVVTKLEEFYVHRYRDTYQAQCRRWPDVNVKHPMIWGEKVNFLRRAVDMNPFGSEMFFWCDIGIFRLERSCGEGGLFRLSEHIQWPDLEVCRASFSDKVALSCRRQLLRRRLFKPHPEDVSVAGMFFGGRADPVRRFADAFYRLVDQRAQSGRSVLTEEPILRDVYAARPDLARLFLVEHIRWLRVLNLYRHPNHWWWYCLNGNQFPWRYFREEISLREVFAALFFGLLRRIKDSRLFSSFSSRG